jgi:glycerophosphoryl diester phosphodiesterase
MPAVAAERRRRATRFPFLDHPLPLAFAHRGGAGGGVENSLAAFADAVDLGFRYLETDVHATSDGVLLAFHDHTLDRVTDGRGRVADLPWSTVRRARIAGREPIVLVEDLLGSWPDVRVNVDVKELSAVGPLIETIRRTKALERVCVASFSARRLSLVRRALGPRLATAMPPREVLALRLASYGPTAMSRRLAASPAAAAQVPVSAGPLPVADQRLVDSAHERGIDVHVWTVDDPSQMHRLLDLGVDGLMTDEPAILREVLRARGVWHG